MAMTEDSGHQVYLSLGSNIDPESSLAAGLNRVQQLLGNCESSSMYYSEAVGFKGPPFLNMVISGATPLSLSALAVRLRNIEMEFGRLAHQQKFSSRRLDIDILLYDGLCGNFEGIELPRPDILHSAYVLVPLVELRPTLIHPGEGKAVRELLSALPRLLTQANAIGLHRYQLGRIEAFSV